MVTSSHVDGDEGHGDDGKMARGSRVQVHRAAAIAEKTLKKENEKEGGREGGSDGDDDVLVGD